MHTLDLIEIGAPLDQVFAAAAQVERWPELLRHYRWVRMLQPLAPDGGGGTVEMAAWRPFGPLRWPTWWVSEMAVDRERHQVRYRHVRGITTGMDVAWRLSAVGSGTRIELIHEWDGPRWPVIGRPAADWVIGPIFVHGIASRTLAGLKRHLEAVR